MKQKVFYTTWHRLAEQLVASGYTLEPCENIYSPGKKAWKLILTNDAAEEISNFYLDHGKSVPNVVTMALHQ